MKKIKSCAVQVSCTNDSWMAIAHFNDHQTCGFVRSTAREALAAAGDMIDETNRMAAESDRERVANISLADELIELLRKHGALLEGED